jgi:hypothetical protein
VIKRKETSEDEDLGPLVRQKPSGVSVLAALGVFLIFLILLALIPGQFGQVAGVVRNELDIPAVVNFGTSAATPSPNLPLAATGGGAVPVAMPGLIPFSPTKTQQFGGRVTQQASLGADVGWGQMHIWISSGSNLREISLAPLWYLQQLGCSNLDNARVTGAGFQFDPSRANAELYAKFVIVNGQKCLLRDDEGLALWGNPTR